MKSILSFFVVFVVVPVSIFAQNYGGIEERYDQTPLASRLFFLKSQAPAALGDEFLIKALLDIDESNLELGTFEEKEQKKSLAIWLFQTVSARKIETATALIARIPSQYKDSFTRGEAWLALARLEDRKSIPEMIRNLRAFNTSVTRTRAEEIQASYLVQAFALLKAAQAFPEVLKASIAWYSPQSQVRESARKILPSLTPDYEASLIGVLQNDEDLRAREGAMELTVALGNTNSTQKAAAALLDSLATLVPHNPREREAIATLRKDTLQLCLSFPNPIDELTRPLKLILGRNDDFDDSSVCVRIFGKMTSDEAAQVLANSLRNYNVRQKSGANSGRDVQLARETIVALGSTRNSIGKTALSEVEFSNYTPAIVRDAQASLSKLKP